MKLSNTSIPYLIFVALVTMFAAVAQAQTVQDWEERDTPLVGRINHLEGTLSRYDAESDEWAATVQHAPVGAGDRLYSDYNSKAELILPNNTWIRMDGDAEIEMMALDTTDTEIDLPLGTVRLYNKSPTAQIKTTTPFGTVVTPAGAEADLYVYSDGIDIIAINKKVYFMHNRSGRRHEITERGAALFADTDQVSASHAEVANDWNKWNNQMDALWATRARTRGESATYLPPELQNDAYALDTHGRWERVYYQGAHYQFWRPVQVHVGWSPFSSGYWHVWWGDDVWIPHEPFGYVTHHYGNWIFTAGHWYWAPPVTRVMINAGLPLFRIGFAWYPGRVAWIHGGAHVGWFPLAPYEPYYCHRRWGRRAYVVTKYRHRHHRRYKYRHRSRAVVIHKAHLYRGKNYRSARIRDISRISADGRFRTAPVLNRSEVKTYRRQVGTKRIRQLREDRKRLDMHTRSRLHERKPGVSVRDQKINKKRTLRTTKPGDQRLTMYRSRANTKNRFVKKDVKKPVNTSRLKAPRGRRPDIQQKRTQTRFKRDVTKPANTGKLKAPRGRRPDIQQKHTQTRFKRDVTKPANTHVSKSQNDRRPTIQQPARTQSKRDTIEKRNRQNRATPPMTVQRPNQRPQKHAPGSKMREFTPNRFVQHQRRQQSHSGYAPQKRNHSRTTGSRPGTGRNYRRGR